MSSTSSDPYLAAALWFGVAAVALTLWLALAIVVLRLRLRRRERRWQAFVHRWRPALLAAILDPSASPVLPRLRPAEHTAFLRLWAYLHESIRGNASAQLNETAEALGVDATVRRLLVDGSRADKLQAVLAAGLLRDRRAWDALLAIAEGEDSLLAVNAARSLVRIDGLQAAQALTPMVTRRTDWDLSLVAGFLGEARQPFWLHLAKVIPELAGEPLERALLLAAALRMQLPDATVARLLQPTEPAAVVRAALCLADNPRLAPPVRACLAHEDAGVRMQAADAMARLATADDLPALTRLLDDADWSVRQAAARTLSRLPFLGADDVERLAPAHPLAADVLRQAAAEQREAA